jgi:hypothetical protein
MKLGISTIGAAALFCASFLSTIQPASAQGAAAEYLRLVYTTLTPNGLYDFQEAQKLVNEGYKKAGMPWRDVWTSALFGELRTFVSVAPVTGLSQFDSPSPMSHLTEAQRIKYQTLNRSSVQSVRAVLVQVVPQLSIQSGRTTPPRLARVVNVRALPGKQLEFEEAIRTIVLPALKKAGAKDYWVHRAILGTAIGEYTIVQLFDSWKEMEAFPTGEKLYGPEGLKQFMSRVAATASSADNMVASLVPDLSYRPQ